MSFSDISEKILKQAGVFKYTDKYREKVSLRNGKSVTMRLVIPADKTLLEKGMDAFSSHSRYHRFLTNKIRLSKSELRYLTEVDGVDHFAIGALSESNQGAGVARFVRFDTDPGVAEPSIAVLDAYQRNGLGKILFTRLMEAARERNIHCFHGRMLSDNLAMKQLLHSVARKICFEYDNRVLEFKIELPTPAR